MNGTRTESTRRAVAATVVLALGLGTALLGIVGTAGSANAAPKEKVGVCHRTGSDTNPYVYTRVPADEANGHITGTAKNHKSPRVWKSDGTWRGTSHVAGDEKRDYLAPGGAADCTDPSAEGPELCPDGTDFAGDPYPVDGDVSSCDEDEESVLCPEDSDYPGQAYPTEGDETSCYEEDFLGSDSNERTLREGDCEAGTVTRTFQFQQGEETAPGSGEFAYGPWQDVETTTRDMTAAELSACGGGSGAGGGAEVLGIEANAPAAAPTAIDAGRTMQESGGGPLWLLAGAAALVLAGAVLGVIPARVRGRHVL